jgi:hypothetical protein
MLRRCTLLLAPLAALCVLAGCDMLGIESPEKVAAVKEADGRAIGGACRHAGRAIEDCYALNRKADKAAVFAGWREMNDYMRENKLEAVAPLLVAPPAAVLAKSEPAPAAADDEGAAATKRSAKPAASAKAKDAKPHDS